MKEVTLKSVCTTFADGDWIESKDQDTSGIRLVQTGNIGGGIFKDRIEKARWISEETFLRLRCTEITEGDVLVSRLPDPVGRAALIPKLDHKAITAVDCSILRFNPDLMIPKFFVYYSQSAEYASKINPLISGATRQRISRENLGLLAIPLPSRSEQKAIVEKLDAAFAEIDQLEELCIRNLNAVSELHRAYIHGLLSRIDVTPKYLNQISENFDSKRRPITKSSRNAGEYPYYGASGIVDYVEEYIFDGEYLLISEDGANLLARSTPIAFPAHGKFWVNNHAHIIQCSTLMDQTFLEFFFNSTDVSAFVTGAAQPKLSQASLHKIPIPFPDTASERAQIVSRIESSSTEIETLLSNLKSQRKMYSELRSSFLSSVFTEKSDAA